MSDERFIEMVTEGYTCRQMAAMTRRCHKSAQARAKRLGVAFTNAKPPRCTICGEERAEMFGKLKGRCRPCWAEYRIGRWRARRRQILAELGGKCAACGFDRYMAALQVHHTDPSLKDPNASAMSHWSWARVARELEHCILLCANCHAGLHNGEHAVEAEPGPIVALSWGANDRRPIPSDGDSGEPCEGPGFRKLTDEEVLEMRQLRQDGARVVELAARFGVSHANVSNITRGKRRADAPWPMKSDRLPLDEALG